MTTVLKTVVPKGTVGSNPIPSSLPIYNYLDAVNGKCALKMLEPSLRIATYLKRGRSVVPNPKAPDVNGTMIEVTGQH